MPEDAALETRQADLEGWIARATTALCADAKRRIRIEIESHYRDTVAALEDSGFDNESAYKTALDGLGDPDAALKAFRKTYLSSEEETCLANSRNAPASNLTSRLGMLWLMLLASLNGTFQDSVQNAGHVRLRAFWMVVIFVVALPALASLATNAVRFVPNAFDHARGRPSPPFKWLSIVAFSYKRFPRLVSLLLIAICAAYALFLPAGLRWNGSVVFFVFAEACLSVHDYFISRVLVRAWNSSRVYRIALRSYLLALTVLAVYCWARVELWATGLSTVAPLTSLIPRQFTEAEKPVVDFCSIVLLGAAASLLTGTAYRLRMAIIAWRKESDKREGRGAAPPPGARDAGFSVVESDPSPGCS